MKTVHGIRHDGWACRATAGICVLAAGVAMLGTSAVGGEICQPCRITAQRMQQAELLEARSDLWLALAKANNNDPEPDAWNEALSEAIESFKEDTELARERNGARLDLCEELGECRYDVEIDPEDFLSPEEIAADPNTFLPLVPGTTYTYEAETEDGTETVTVEVTDETREILGVECIVVHDVAELDGEVIEDTLDWLTQDVEGNVWYFGEQSLEYEDGVVTGNDGSWEAGVDGALPGILMRANPMIGDVYRQEYALGEAEDAARVLAFNQTVEVPFGVFNGCLKTADFTPMEPDVLEYKYYAPGVGVVLTEDAESGDREELVDIQ